MKRLNKTHIFHIFFGLLMFLPFISILSRVIYVQSNKNAKDSYYGETINDVHYDLINDKDDLEINNKYFLDLKAISVTGDIGVNSQRIYFDIIDIKYNTSGFDLTTAHSVAFYNSNNWIYTYWYDSNNTSIATFAFINNVAVEMNIKYVSNTLLSNNILNYDILYEIHYNEYSYLDNVFDYSISKFIEDNNFRINFFSWFEDLFLVQNGGVNALYLSFANWYMCYALLVSTGYLLFLILMWFINYVRKILEGGNSFGHGGF